MDGQMGSILSEGKNKATFSGQNLSYLARFLDRIRLKVGRIVERKKKESS